MATTSPSLCVGYIHGDHFTISLCRVYYTWRLRNADNTYQIVPGERKNTCVLVFVVPCAWSDCYNFQDIGRHWTSTSLILVMSSIFCQITATYEYVPAIGLFALKCSRILCYKQLFGIWWFNDVMYLCVYDMAFVNNIFHLNTGVRFCLTYEVTFKNSTEWFRSVRAPPPPCKQGSFLQFWFPAL